MSWRRVIALCLNSALLLGLSMGLYGCTNEKKAAAKTSEITSQSEKKVNQFPKYLAVHKADFGGGPNGWVMGNPYSVTQDGFDEILKAVGTKGTDDCRLAVSYTFEFGNHPLANVKYGIQSMLDLALKNDVPIILHLDDVNYLDSYPELWNFFDKDGKGYNPENIKNVERYGWSEDDAVKIGWRNWGTQIRVKPAINLVSKAFRAMQKECLDELYPVIAQWYQKLPANKKYLLGGVVIGWELSTYQQSYYYKGGNNLLDKPSTDDPTNGPYTSLPLGYAAAQDLGIQTDGVITSETEDKICANFVEFVTQIALNCGIPANRLITHTFNGGETVYGAGQSGIASISKHKGVMPGWSFYGNQITELDQQIDFTGNGPWAAIEFKPDGLSGEYLYNVLNYRQCRIVNIYNWESLFYDEDNGVQAVTDALKLFETKSSG